MEDNNKRIREAIIDLLHLVDNNNESRFKAGDWVVTSYGKVNQVITVDGNNGFTLDDGTYLSSSGKDDYHLWSISDAKRGDVLVSHQSIFLFKRVYMAGKPEAYCAVMENSFIKCPGGCWTNDPCCPATKEQRELLFKKMKEFGYKWDFKNRELILLQPVSKPSEVVWTEEDETGFEDTLWAINKARVLAKDENDMGNLWYAENWLRELKERIGG